MASEISECRCLCPWCQIDHNIASQQHSIKAPVKIDGCQIAQPPIQVWCFGSGLCEHDCVEIDTDNRNTPPSQFNGNPPGTTSGIQRMIWRIRGRAGYFCVQECKEEI